MRHTHLRHTKVTFEGAQHARIRLPSHSYTICALALKKIPWTCQSQPKTKARHLRVALPGPLFGKKLQIRCGVARADMDESIPKGPTRNWTHVGHEVCYDMMYAMTWCVLWRDVCYDMMCVMESLQPSWCVGFHKRCFRYHIFKFFCLDLSSGEFF